jgi:hypothetical protein
MAPRAAKMRSPRRLIRVPLAGRWILIYGFPEHHLLDLASPDRAVVRAHPAFGREPILPSMRPGRRVVALREVEEMAHARTTTEHDVSRGPHHLRDLPPGEGSSCACC